jgi:hypothetical protein
MIYIVFSVRGARPTYVRDLEVNAKECDGYSASKLRVEACILKTFEETAKSAGGK